MQVFVRRPGELSGEWISVEEFQQHMSAPADQVSKSTLDAAEQDAQQQITTATANLRQQIVSDLEKALKPETPASPPAA